MSEHRVEDPAQGSVQGSRLARWIRRLAVPIVLLWVAIAALTNVSAPQLEVVGAAHSVAQSSPDSPSLQAMMHIGHVFGEFDSDSSAMIVLEGEQHLGADAHHFYDTLVQKLSHDTHVEHIQDFWGDPLTAGAAQSKDGKAAYVQVYLRGNQGQALSNQSVDAVRDIVSTTPAPPGVKAYVTGAAPLLTDNFEVGSQGTVLVTLVTFGVIALMLLDRLPLARHHDHRAGDGPGRVGRRARGRRRPREFRDHRSVDLLDEPAHPAGHRRRHRLRHLPRRPLPRSTLRR